MGSRGSIVPFFNDLVKSGAQSLPITDERMTRFWLRLDQAIELVIYAMENMRGGELYVKKIPSIKILDLAKAIAPDLATKIVGIRPGEKIHEKMISSDDARNTLELDDHYIIQPDFSWWKTRNNTLKGKPVSIDFEYHSGNNDKWLTVEEIRKLIAAIQI